MNYWLITKRDGSSIYIPPQSVDIVKKRWDNRLPIHTSQGSVPPSEIKSFEPSDKPYSDTPLLEAASRAFNEPIYTDGGIDSKWVKKDVPVQMYDKHYSKIPGYKRLASNNAYITIAFRLPTHTVPDTVNYCTIDEINLLTRST